MARFLNTVYHTDISPQFKSTNLNFYYLSKEINPHAEINMKKSNTILRFQQAAVRTNNSSYILKPFGEDMF